MRPTSLKTICLVATLGVMCGAQPLDAQAVPTAPAVPTVTVPAYRGRLLGVYNGQTGDPVEGAEVMDALSKTKALTSKTGTVSLAFLPDGGSMVRVQKIGFQPMTIVVAISPVDTVPITLILTPLATTLPTVVTRDSAPRYVSPALQAFEERRRGGMGHFITEADLRKSDASKMTNVLRRLPNINIVCPRSGPRRGECWATAGRARSKLAVGGGTCDISVYINGTPAGDTDLEKLSVTDFAGIEYYSGGATIPPLYNMTGSSCGVLLLWSRER